MRKMVSIRDLKIGDILEEPVKDDEGVDLVTKGTVLTDGVLARLRRWFTGRDFLVTIDDGTDEYDPNNLDEVKDKSIESLKNVFAADDEDIQEELDKLSGVISNMAKDLEDITTIPSDALKIDDECISGEHYFRVARLAMAVASIYNKSVSDDKKLSLESIGMTAFLHDYGKKFNRTGENSTLKMIGRECTKLDELSNIDSKKTHHTYAYIALRGKVDSDVRRMILFGSYDDSSLVKSSSNKCVQGSRIIKVCDIYDGLLELVSKKRITSPCESVVDYMSEVAENGDISKDFYKLFASRLPLYARGTKVLLSNEQYAVVVDNNEDPTRPIVLTLTGGAPTIINLNEDDSISIVSIEKKDTSKKVNSDFIHDQIKGVYESLENNNSISEIVEMEEENHSSEIVEEKSFAKRIGGFFRAR